MTVLPDQPHDADGPSPRHEPHVEGPRADDADDEPLAFAEAREEAAPPPTRVPAAVFFDDVPAAPPPGATVAQGPVVRPLPSRSPNPFTRPPWRPASFWRRAPAELPRHVEADRFFLAPAPPRERPLLRWAERPSRLGLILFIIGAFAVLVNQANLLTQIVIGAPVFEEMFKFGLALILVTALRVRDPVLRLLLALIPGAGFGIFEHATTYPGETIEGLIFRIIFHAGTPALSMSLYDAVEPVGDVRVRWASVVPSIMLHWANNFGAVVLAIVAGLIMTTPADGPADTVGVMDVAYYMSSFLAVSAHVLAWATVMMSARVRGVVLRAWTRWAPSELRDGPSRGVTREAAPDEAP